MITRQMTTKTSNAVCSNCLKEFPEFPEFIDRFKVEKLKSKHMGLGYGMHKKHTQLAMVKLLLKCALLVFTSF